MSATEKPKVILAGGSGFLGQSLATFLLEHDYAVTILTRSPKKRDDQIEETFWDGKTVGEWAQYLNGATAIVNLAGKSVNCRYTPENRREIIESRTDSVHAIAAAIAQCQTPPKAWIQASAIGIYGNGEEQWFEENSPPGDDFMAEVCRKWEEAFQQVEAPQTRKVALRISVVLGVNGGALATLAGVTKCFLGGSVGTGRQYISWVHQTDMNAMFLTAIHRDEIVGIYNACNANPVTNAEFMRDLRHALHRPWSPPVPAFAVRIGSWFLRTEADLALTGRRCAPRRFLAQGFEFQFSGVPSALANLLSDSAKSK